MSTNEVSPSLFRQDEVVSEYTRRKGLMPSEVCAFARVNAAGKKSVLDLGVGAGRTTSFLATTATHYVGIEPMPEMRAACRKMYPDADIRDGDARDLHDYDDGIFDLIVFSFNGIDYMPYGDRILVFRECFRTLRKGGHFVYSTHNLNAVAALEAAPPYKWPKLSLNPLRTAKRLADFAASVHRTGRNRKRLKPLEERHATHAVINDPAYDFGHLTIYASPQAEIEQLTSVGFADTPQIIDRQGLDTTTRSEDNWLYFIAHKAD